MKRFFFSIIALAAAAVSCTQSALLETPTLDGTAVSFSPYTGRTPVTKATSIATATELGAEGGFNVYCFLNGDKTNPLLAAEPVTMTDGVWGYTNTIFWPASGSLDFVAYSANAVDKGLVLNGTTGFTFTVQDAVSNQVDLLATAYQAGKTATSEGVSGGDVTLKFFHLLSRVGFKVQTGSTRAFTVKSLSITGDAPVAGTLTFEDYTGEEIPALTPTQTEEDKEYFYVNTDVEMTEGAAEATAITGMDSQYMMFMPHSAAGHVISITYTIGDSETEKTATAALPADFKFLQGKAYEFILKISTSTLTFDVTEEEWNETGDTDLQPEPEEEQEEEPTPEQFPEVDEKTKSEYGFIYNVVAYDYDTHLLTVKIDIIDTSKLPSGAEGLRISMNSKFADGTTSGWKNNYLQFYNPTSLSNCSASNGFKNFQGSYTVYLNQTNLKKDAEVTFCCYFYAPSSMGNTFKGSSAYQKTFSTTGSFDYSGYYNRPPENDEPGGATDELDPTEQPVVTIESLTVNQSAKTAVVTGSFIEGISSITNYGFCWMTGAGTPSISNTHYECTSSFSHTITGLSEGVYSCCAYVTTKDGETYYSPVRTIEIEPAVNEEDNTGSGSWESGDEY